MSACPNENAQGYIDLYAASGNNQNVAYGLWAANKNNFLDLTPQGKESILYKELLKTYTPVSAISKKSLIYSDSFKKFFGNWRYAIDLKESIANTTESHLKANLENRLKNLNVGTVDANGEPTLQAIQDYEKSINPVTTFSDNLKENLAQTKIKIIEVLNHQKKIFGSENGGKRGAQWNKDIDDLLDSIKGSEELDEVNLARLIDDSVKYIKLTNQIISRIYELSKTDYRILSQSEKDELSAQLVRAKEFISTYNVLDDVRRSYIEAGQPIPHEGKISEAVLLRNDSMKRYEDVMYSMIADWIFPSLEKTNANLEASGNQVITKDKLLASLKLANADIDMFAYYFGSTINVSEIGTSSIALTIKRLVENIRMQDLEVQQTLGSLYDQKSGNKGDVADFNKPYLTEIEVPSSEGYVKQAAIHTPFHTDVFQKNLNDFHESARKLDTNELLVARRKWYEENTRLMPNMKEYIDNKRSELSIDEFNTWWHNNTIEMTDADYNGKMSHEYYTTFVPGSAVNGKFRIYSGELVIPADKYINNKFRELYENDSYFKELYDAYDEANQKLPINKRLKHGLLPQVDKSYSEAAKAAGADLGAQLELAKTRLKESLNVQGRDASYGLVSQSGQEVKNVPIYFTSKIDEKNVSKDLLSSVLLFSHMANHFSEFDRNEPYILMVKDMVLGNPALGIAPRKVTNTKSTGEAILGSVTGKPISKTAEIKVNDRLNQFLDSVVYNEQEILTNIQVFGKTVSLNKIANSMSLLTAINTMALNLNGGINNSILGNISTFYGGAGGDTYSSSEWVSAQASYNKDLKDIIGDFSKATPTSKTNLINEYFDSIQGQFQDEYGHEISHTVAKRLFSTSTLFFVNNIAEHQIQSVGTQAVLKGKKFTGKAFETKEEYIRRKAGRINEITPSKENLDKYNKRVAEHNAKRKEAEAEFNQIKENLFDALEVKNGRLQVKDAYKQYWTEADRFNTMNKIHAINKMIHGNYNKFDKSVMQRKALGKLMVMFRKHIYTGFRKRYCKEYVDVELADVYEGYYRSFFGKLAHDIKEYGVLSALTIQYTSSEMEARRKVLTELATIAACMLVMGLLGAGGDDDEPNSFVQNHIALQARRLQQDFMFYLPVVGTSDLFRIVANPAVSTSQIIKFGRLINQAVPIYSDGPFEQYSRKSGVFEKGDYKIKARLLDVTPVAGKILDFLTPEDQLKVFNRAY